jgi:hypothetical protein
MKYKINGKYVTKEEWDARPGVGLKGGVPMGTVAYSESKPLISEGLGCIRSEVPKMRAMVREEKIQGVHVLDSGQVAITSRSGRRKLIRVLNEIRGCRMVDADGGYGDG